MNLFTCSCKSYWVRKLSFLNVSGSICSYSTPTISGKFRSRVGPLAGSASFNTSAESSSKSSSSGGASCYDITIVGGGIVGMATALELAHKFPNFKLAVLEKESALGTHQSGHNSGVVHAGIYYKPGSLRAKLCVQGLKLSYKYFDENKIPYKKVGKLIVAVTQEEVGRLKDLYERGQQNNVPNLKLIDGSEIKNYEPHCQGMQAIWSPETGIVDWGLVTRSYGENFKKLGGDVHLNYCAGEFSKNPASNSSEYPIAITSTDRHLINSKYVLTCGGLQSDRLAELSGCRRDPRIIPVRGEYLLLNPEKCNLIRGNIYPVPDPRVPFLGVHFTPRMDGSVWLGPNAILAFKREGYAWKDFDAKDFLDSIRYRGFQKLVLKYAAFGTSEMIRSAFIRLQLKELRKYIPQIGPNDISRGPAGVRAQAMDSDGNLIEDFIFDSGTGDLASRILHVRNAPSPGATSSLAIAKMVVEKMEKEFQL